MSSSSRIAVVGAGISGLSAAWLLSKRHDVTLFESDRRAGGHSNTVEVSLDGRATPVDTGFIVYNTQSYPNLIALFRHLDVPTARSNMSFAVSLRGGAYEYSGTGIAGIFGQPANALRPSHLRMLVDIRRFFTSAPELLAVEGDCDLSLGAYLDKNRYSRSFVEHHIVPMAAAIWSTPAMKVLDFPAAAFVRFFANHGLLQIKNRPEWRTVSGGSAAYVSRMLADFRGRLALGARIQTILRDGAGATLVDAAGERSRFDKVILACHADEALAMLGDADAQERALLSPFGYQPNRAVLHTDERQMPRRRRIWSSWNYVDREGAAANAPSVTYWMNRLQPLGRRENVFVTLNPATPIASEHVRGEFHYTHPVFDAAAMAAQRDLWRLQGRRRTWFCGSYWGYGFHEDGLQAGLAAAEAAGDVRRPWSVADESGRIHLRPADTAVTSTIALPQAEAAE